MAAEAGGGKFANGAVSAAFAQAFNDLASDYESIQVAQIAVDGGLMGGSGRAIGALGGVGAVVGGAGGVSTIIDSVTTESEESESTRVRHYTSVEYMKSIRSSGIITPSGRERGGKYGIFVAVPDPILGFNNKTNFGQAHNDAYVEFSVPKHILLPDIPGGPNARFIVTGYPGGYNINTGAPIFRQKNMFGFFWK